MLYYRYSDYLKKQYGEKVYKLPVNIPGTCPNRDGSIGTGGCAFCGERGAGHEAMSACVPVEQQLQAEKALISRRYKAKKFIAYFQNFTSTYRPVEELHALLNQARQPDIVEIAVATRPDCLGEEYLDMFRECQRDHNIKITIELGLQSANDETLLRINRGHDTECYRRAMNHIAAYGFPVCTHMILNLPYDRMEDVLAGAKLLRETGSQQVKLHSLYLVMGTRMAEEYEAGKIAMISCEEYQERVITFLEHLPVGVAVQRLLGRAPAAETIFSNWGRSWWIIQNEIEARMRAQGRYQGRCVEYVYVD